MSQDRGFSEPGSDVLGVLVHGPVVVARSPGIALAVRCVFAHPRGLELDLVLRAVGVQAEAAGRQTFARPFHRDGAAAGSDDRSRGRSAVDLVIEVDRRRTVTFPCEQSSSGNEGEFESEMRVSLAGLPSDGVVTLTASWPAAGLAEGIVHLTLDSLDDLDRRVIRLP